MENIIGKTFLRNKLVTNMSWVVVILSGLLLILALSGETSSTPILVPLIFSIINIATSGKPVLTFSENHLEFKNSGFGRAILIKYDSIVSVKDLGKNIEVTANNIKRPYKFHTSNFNKGDIEAIKECFLSLGVKDED